MPPIDDGLPVTELLHRYGGGDRDAGEQLAEIVYRSLHERAQKLMHGERPAHTLRATGLVNEAWMRLGVGATASCDDRGHFLRLAGRVMRNVLIDHARNRKVARRAQHEGESEALRMTLSDTESDPVDILALHEALQKLGQMDEELAAVVELRFFGGLTFEETGEALGISGAGAHRAWRLAQAWLLRELG